MKHVNPEERPRKEDYDRYLSLLYLFRRLEYDPREIYRQSPFKVVDVGFNAILQRANRDLYALAVLLQEDPYEIEEWIVRGEVGPAALWDREAGFYFSWDLVAGEPIAVKTSAGFLPLFAGTPHQGRASLLAQEAERWGKRRATSFPAWTPRAPSLNPGGTGGARCGSTSTGWWPRGLGTTVSPPWRQGSRRTPSPSWSGRASGSTTTPLRGRGGG